MTTDSTDKFLQHVFPGSSEATRSFRVDIERLNRYCQRHKGAIRSILLTGETGVGKTRTAHIISAHSQWLTLTEEEKHNFFYDSNRNLRFPADQLVELLLSKEHLPRRDARSRHVRRLATVLAPQLSDELAASELFGHKKHAFTGAAKEHPGIFGDEAVDDVLLDEIADLSPRVQAKLLQFIETRTFRPVGGMVEDERTSHHRLFLATNRPLLALVQSGEFREDLYHRIQGHHIEIPPLRARQEVMRDLAYSILRSVNYAHRGPEQIRQALKEELAESRFCLLPESDWEGGKPTISSWVVKFDERDLLWCEEYNWPGNVRELKHRVEQYVFHNGNRRLPDVMPVHPCKGLPAAGAVDCDQEDEQGIIGNLVSLYLQKVLDGIELPPGQPSDLLERFAKSVRIGVYRFKTEKRLKRMDLERIFPNAKDPESTIGRWRP